MKKIGFVSIIACLFLLIFSHLVLALEHGYMDSYKEICEEVIGLIDAKPINHELLLKNFDEMITMGVIIAKSVNVDDSKCRRVLDLYIEDSQLMKVMSLEEIKTLYHEGMIFQKKGLVDITLNDEKYKECMEIIQFIVHPSIIYTLIKNFKNYNSVSDTGHINKVKEELTMLYNHIKNHEKHH